MANTFFEYPTRQEGTPEEQLRGLYSYLYQMSERLNEALNDISLEQMEDSVQKTVREAGKLSGQAEENRSSLKSLIIKTAEIVRTEMTELSTVLTRNYEALSSQFGSYEENLTNTITATAEGILQDYRYEERVEGAERYVKRTSQFIFSGLLDPVNMIYGVAIGDNVTGENGELVDANKMATFTKDELAFYMNGVKVAWFSNSTFYIDRGQVEESLQIGLKHRWQVLSDGSIALISVREEISN